MDQSCRPQWVPETGDDRVMCRRRPGMVSESAVPWNALGCTGIFNLKKLHTNNTFLTALKRSNITDFKGGTPAESQHRQTERFQPLETAGSNGSKRETSVSQEEGQKQASSQERNLGLR